MKRVVSNKRKKCHVTIMVDGTKEDFTYIVKGIREMIRKRAHSPKDGMSYDVVFMPSREIDKEMSQGYLQEFQFPLCNRKG